MPEELVSAPVMLKLDGFRTSYLPWLEITSIGASCGFALVVVLAAIIALRFKSRFDSNRIKNALVVGISILVLMSSIPPIWEYLTQASDLKSAKEAGYNLAFGAKSAVASLGWTFTAFLLILTGITRFSAVGIATACIVSTYFLVFPLFYSSLQGVVLLGPGPVEVSIISLTAMMTALIRHELSRTMVVSLTILIITAASLSALAAIALRGSVLLLESASGHF
jgi:hypothetical protein